MSDPRLQNLISEAVQDAAAKNPRVRFIPLSTRHAIAEGVLAALHADGWTLLRPMTATEEAAEAEWQQTVGVQQEEERNG